MDKKPKLEFSKFIVFLSIFPWLISISLVFYYMQAAMSGNPYITGDTIMYLLMYMTAPSFAPFTFALTCYYIKTKGENLIKLKIFSIASMIKLQEENPGYKIYQTDDIRQDADTIDDAVEQQLDNMMVNAISEQPNSVI